MLRGACFAFVCWSLRMVLSLRVLFVGSGRAHQRPPLLAYLLSLLSFPPALSFNVVSLAPSAYFLIACTNTFERFTSSFISSPALPFSKEPIPSTLQNPFTPK